MTSADFLLQMDEILGLRAGTIQGFEKLDELENWDSLALISFIALAQSHSGVSTSPQQIVSCSTVADLLRIARVDVATSPTQVAKSRQSESV
jgi:acyl carrier protein